MFDKKAFTLSELLIAMTIIGVIAALTVPQLMANTTARSNRMKVQKAYATLANAFSIAESKLGYNTADLEYVSDYSLHTFLTKSMNVTLLDLTSYPFAGRLIKGSTNGALDVDNFSTSGISANAQVYKAKDGVHYVFPELEKRKNSDGFENIGCTKSTPCVGYIDIDGPDKGPNALITCTSNGSDAYPYYDVNTKNWEYPDDCTVDPSAITDIYPFVFYDAEIIPAVNAFDAVLSTEIKK